HPHTHTNTHTRLTEPPRHSLHSLVTHTHTGTNTHLLTNKQTHPHTQNRFFPLQYFPVGRLCVCVCVCMGVCGCGKVWRCVRWVCWGVCVCGGGCKCVCVCVNFSPLRAPHPSCSISDPHHTL